ncbi:GLPGLI family protein [Aestuariibaculum suncheonense]|uniref:GLPGLI family protein n=1 Tax=Aestuariibaculum suncheonense TaxID=1028745 RepID=A0A8J6UBW0_9FLAO|nr:GLPGLI family protein [Aestuariibaculum suncheonense]MBD0836220.1 GLPGLI family protein [Aestuariibaculum suncheonense]
MKYFKHLALGSALLVSVVAFAQKEFQGIAYYQSNTNVDMQGFGGGDIDPERQKRMAERMKEMLDKTYVLTFNQIESFYKVEETEAAGGGRWRGMMNSFSNGPQYKNIKEKQLIQDQEFFGKQFIIKDELPNLDWKMTNESKKIGDYMCLKATTTRTVPNVGPGNFRRRADANGNEEEPAATKEVEVEAWYTLQLPINQGPGDYWGLPGLILEVTVDRTTLYCSKIIMNPAEKVAIEAPSKGKEITRADYDDLVKKKMEEMRAQFSERAGDRRF